MIEKETQAKTAEAGLLRVTLWNRNHDRNGEASVDMGVRLRPIGSRESGRKPRRRPAPPTSCSCSPTNGGPTRSVMPAIRT